MLNLTIVMQRGIVLFWALWWTLVSISDSINWLQEAGALLNNWLFNSKNYTLVAQSLETYHIISPQLTLFLFALIILSALLIAMLFWLALLTALKAQQTFQYRAILAFLASFTLTAIFILVDEVFLQYELEHGHIIRLGVILITFLAFKQKPTT